MPYSTSSKCVQFLLDKSDIQFLPFHINSLFIRLTKTMLFNCVALFISYIFYGNFLLPFSIFPFSHALFCCLLCFLACFSFSLNCTVIACNENVSFPFILSRSFFFRFSHSNRWYFISSPYSLRTMHYFHDILKYKCLLFSLFYFFHMSCLLLPSPTISHISATPNVLNQIALAYKHKIAFYPISSYRLLDSFHIYSLLFFGPELTIPILYADKWRKKRA